MLTFTAPNNCGHTISFAKGSPLGNSLNWAYCGFGLGLEKFPQKKSSSKFACNAAVSNLFSCVSACFCEAGFLFRLDNKRLKLRCF